MKTFAILLLLGVINAREAMLLDTQLSADAESEAGALGSLEQAFLEQKLKRHQRMNSIEMIGLNTKEWDSDVLGLVDENEYAKDVQSTLHEQELNIELENKPHAVNKQLMAQTGNKDNLEVIHKDGQHQVGQPIPRTNLNVSEMQKQLQKKLDQEKLQQKENKIKLANIQKEKEATLKKLAEIKAQKEKKFQADVAHMNKEWDMFCRTFDMSHYQNAMTQWAEIDQEGIHPIEVLKVNTKQIFEKEGFQFPEVAKNDYASDQLGQLENAQTNLNRDINNQVVIDKFIAVAQETIKNLKHEYQDGFTDPGTKPPGSVAQVSSSSDED